MGNKTDIPSIYQVCSPTCYDKDEKHIAPAHYTAAEIAAWWTDMVEYFPYTPVSEFKDNRLSNGELGSAVDLNNLTTVQEFCGKAPGDGTLTHAAPRRTAGAAGHGVESRRCSRA